MANKIIEVKNLTKKYDDNIVLNDISFTVNQCDIYGFLGRNGSGKSTMMKAILNLIKIDNGSINVFGENIYKSDRYLSKVGSLIEEPSFYPNLTGYENLKLVQKLTNLPISNINKALEIVGLTDHANKLAKNYSLGMKQRLGIALALVKFPKILILDEPTNGLDPEGVIEIRDLIISLPEKYGITVFISSHILTEIEKMVNKVAILDKGKIKFEGSMDDLNKDETLMIKVDDLSKAESLLQKEKYDFYITKGEIAVKNVATTEIININKYLVMNDIGVSSLYLFKNSLEDKFMQVTSGGHK